jgi:hypothetical protein
MKTIPIPAAILSSIFILFTAGLAQSPPPPAPRSGIPSDIPVEEWKEFKHEAANFSVMMPGKPREESLTVGNDAGKIYTLIAQGETLNYWVTCSEYPIPLGAPGGLDAARDMALSLFRKRNVKLISETEISFGKYPGRDFRAQFDGGALRSRAYVVNRWTYTLMVGAPGDDESKQLDSKKVNDFFGSFKFLKEPQPAEASAPSMPRPETESDKLTLPARPASWREVPSPEFGFAVWMPNEPVRKKIPLEPSNRRLDINVWMSASEDSLYQMIVQPVLVAPRSEEQQKTFFRIALSGILSGGKVELEDEKSISFEEHPGREYKLRTSFGVGTGRAYIIGSTIYFLVVLPVKKPVEGKETSAEFAKFLDSFRLIKDPGAAK